MDALSRTQLSVEDGSDVAIGECVGRLTIDDVEAAATHMLDRIEALADPPRNMLWDLRQSELALSQEETRRLVAFIAGRVGRSTGRTAYVVANDLAFGVMRVYQALRRAEDPSIRIFRDRAEAEAWVAESLE